MKFSRTYFLCVILLFLSIKSFAQFGVSCHQSGIPFIGFNYQIGEQFLPELRIGTNNYFEDTGLELAVNYIFKETTDAQAYAGLGARFNLVEGIVIPLGLNIYPFSQKSFGFQVEFAPLVATEGESDLILRGSWGIRYRFLD